MRQAYPEIEAVGGRALAVSVGHGFQAEALIAAGMPFPLLIDREKRVAHALGVRVMLIAREALERFRLDLSALRFDLDATRKERRSF